ncbi:MAG: MFS transporter [Dehalococcoidia bacterium]
MQGFLQGFRALRHPNYRLFWIGQLVSLIGTWMQTVAQSWLVLQLTGSAVALGIVGALQMFPTLVIGIFCGVLADRWRKRDILVVTQTLQMLFAFILAVLVSTHHVQLWHIYVLATLLGIANAFDMPVRQAFVMEMVGREDLINAVALNSMQFNAARVIGPALAGISIAAIGISGSFYANGISFVAVIGGLLAMRSKTFYAVPTLEQRSILESLREGCVYVWQTPVVLLITLLVGAIGMFAFNYNVLLPIFAQSILKVGPTGFGWLGAVYGIGSLAGAFVAAFTNRARWIVLFAGALGFFLMQFAFAFSRSYQLSLILLAVAGFCLINFFTSANTAVQQQVPDELRGRVMGVYMTLNNGTTPFGNILTGWLAGAFGATVALALSMGSGLICLLAGAVWLASHRRSPRLRIQAAPRPRTPVSQPRLHALSDAGD